MKLHPFFPAVLLVLGFASSTRADLLFSNLGQDVDGETPFDSLDTLLATDFLTGGTPWSITSVTAALGNTSPIDALTVTFRIFKDNGSGAPDALFAAFATPATVPSDQLGTFTATSPGINLQPNTTYWVVGQVNETSIIGAASWLFSFSEGTDFGPYSTVSTTPFMHYDGQVWSSIDDGNFMFSLVGTPIPEPSTLPVLLTAGTVVAFGWWGRRRVASGRLPGRGL